MVLKHTDLRHPCPHIARTEDLAFHPIMTIAEQVEYRQASLACSLGQCRLFEGLAHHELESIAEITVAKPFEKNAYLFHEGDRPTGFYIVQEGAVSLHRVNAEGREQVIHIFREDESFGEASIATDAGRPADARAVEPSRVLLVQKTGFLGLLRHRPELALRTLASISRHYCDLIAQIDDLRLKDVESRLMNWLLKRCPDPASDQAVVVRLDTTKRVLASEIGAVSETLSRTMARLRSQDLIAIDGKTITVKRPVDLAWSLKRHLGER